MNDNTQNDWKEIASNEAYKLSQAEFKGATIQALQDIREDIQEMKRDREVKGYINYFISALIGMIAGIVGSGKHL